MNTTSHLAAGMVLAAALLAPIGALPARSQEVGLVTVDVKEVAKGYRVSALKFGIVYNDKREKIGTLDDFIIGLDDKVFAVIEAGGIVGMGGHLVAVPFKSLVLNDPSGRIVLPGASRAAMEKLPVFFYGG